MKRRIITILTTVLVFTSMIAMLSYNAVTVEATNQFVSISVSKTSAQGEFTRITHPWGYEYTMLSGDVVEIGDSTTALFKLHIKYTRWNEECWLTLEIPNIVFQSVVPTDDNVVTGGAGVADILFYTFFGGAEYGNFEMQMNLNVKPLSNIISFNLEAEGLTFRYQPELTQEQIDAGISCPENVSGSYAVYHESKRGNDYETGKAFHIFSPFLSDSEGWVIEGTLSIDTIYNVMLIEIPQDFLDNAVYPIYHAAGLTFGYTSVGEYAVPIAAMADSYRTGNAWTMPNNGTVNYIRAYISSDGSEVADCKVSINQKDSGGTGMHGQVAGFVENLNCIAAGHWEEFTLSGETLEKDIDYIPNIMADPSDLSLEFYSLYCDSGVVTLDYLEIQPYSSPENPWTNIPGGAYWDFSIYVDYTLIEESSPTVTNSTGESDVADTTARLNGELTAGGVATCKIYWGDNDGGTNPELWDYCEDLGEKTEGTFYKDVSGLTPETPYYYRCYATNGEGNDWADTTEPFTTTATPPYPIFTGTVTNDPSSSGRSSTSFSHTTPADEDRLLVVIIGYDGGFSGYNPSSVTYNSVALTMAVRKEAGGYHDTDIWYLKEPATGSNTVAVTWTGAVNPSCVSVISYKNVDQTTPVDATGSNSGLSNSPSTNITTNNADSLVVGGLFIEGGDTEPFTEGTNITERYDGVTGTSSFSDSGYWGGEKEKATAGATTLDCTASASDDWAICAIEVCGAVAGGTLDIITNFPDKDFGIVKPNTTHSTGLDYYSLQNKCGGGAKIDGYIHETDWIGGDTWTLSDTATPGVNTIGVKAGLEGGSYNIIVRKTEPYNLLFSDLADDATISFGRQLLTPTETTDDIQKEGITTVYVVFSE